MHEFCILSYTSHSAELGFAIEVEGGKNVLRKLEGIFCFRNQNLLV